MKLITTGLRAHLAGEVTTLATCWRVELGNGTVYGFTDHDEDIVFELQTYLASSGYSASEVQTSADLSVDNLEVLGFLDSPVIVSTDLVAGLWDYAAISMFCVDWNNLTLGAMQLRSGTLGEITLRRGKFSAELRGITQALTRAILEIYSPGCRARLGDARCTVDLSDRTSLGIVLTATNDRVFSADYIGSPLTVRLTPTTLGAPTENFFRGGLLTWLTGLNTGLDMEVKSNTASGSPVSYSAFQLQLSMPYTVAIGDTFSVQAGCDKSFATCIAKFGNAINFRGEPFVPGLDAILQQGGA